jgi:hypothetical protein
MQSEENSRESTRPGDLLRTNANGRTVIYRADRVDNRARLVEGALLDEGGSVISGFLMSFDAWESTAERSRA